jgi:formyltetrahydrofolate deformylase
MNRNTDTAILLIDSADRKGLVATISEFLYRHGANILHADQHQDNDLKLFFMRVEWDLSEFELNEETFVQQFSPLAAEFGMRWRLEWGPRRPAVAIFVSRQLHCLIDLLHRYQIGELPCTIPMIISNHTDAQRFAEFYHIPFHYVPVSAETKAEAEAKEIQLIEAHQVRLIVLARYMQVLSPAFVARYPRRIINVHHSFLPAFSGAKPYHGAFERGVKLIGATSHYVTDVLDEGPIIEQDVLRVSHRDGIDDLIQKGRDVERIVLSRGVKWHLEHRILGYANKTVVFD